MGYFLGPLGNNNIGVMGIFFGPLGNFFLESWASFLDPRHFFLELWFPDFQTPPPADEFSDPNLTPLPTHPRIKYVARALAAMCLVFGYMDLHT